VDSAQTFVAQSKIPGANGIFDIDSSGAWTYVTNSAFDYLNIGDKLVDSFVVCSADGTTTTVKVTINGTNDPAILSSAKIDLDEIAVPQKAKGKLTISDLDNPEVFIEKKDFPGTTGTFNIDASGAWSYEAKSNFEELKKGQTVSDSFTVTSSDGTTTSVKITIHGTEPSPFRGKYFGGRIGLNRSSSTGTTDITNQPKATTLVQPTMSTAWLAGALPE
jgi:VCBS repeat-containing protein